MFKEIYKMLRPKILIQRRKTLDKNLHYRYYKVHSQPTLNLNDMPFINTEAQLCRFIFDNFGVGRYRVHGFVKGHSGFWTLWLGDITNQGFTFDNRKIGESGDVLKLKKELEEVQDEEEKKWIKEEIELEKKVKRVTKFGFSPYLISSGRRGNFVYWEDCGYGI